MTWPSLFCVMGSVLLLLAFLAAVVFVDPAAYFESEDLDFCGLTSFFFTIGMLPLAFLLFSNDAKVEQTVKQIHTSSGATAMSSGASAKGWPGVDRDQPGPSSQVSCRSCLIPDVENCCLRHNCRFTVLFTSVLAVVVIRKGNKMPLFSTKPSMMGEISAVYDKA